jgi:cell division septum initiation protein DivIVA
MVAIQEQFGISSRQVEQPKRRFSWSLLGYRRRAVDQHIAELELDLSELDRELVELRAAASLREEVAHEMRRIGEETAGVLIEAHHQRDAIVRAAEEEARRLVAEATTRARELMAQGEAVHRERDRLLENAMATSKAIADAVSAAHQQIPAMTTPEMNGLIRDGDQPIEPEVTISDRRGSSA